MIIIIKIIILLPTISTQCTLTIQFNPTHSMCICSVQFSSVTQSCPILCDPMNHSTPGLPVHHQPPESTQIHVH